MSERMVIPADWTFEKSDVAASFDRHVREQLPWYDLATGLIAHVARHYIPVGGTVYDLGASTGNIGRAINDVLESRSACLIPVEKEPAMAARYDGPGRVVVKDVCDVAEGWGDNEADVIVAFLTFMFVPVYNRERLLARCRQALRPGGVLLIVDKNDAPGGYLGTAIRRLTLAGKVATGTPSEEIVSKELSLSGIQRPVPLGWPEDGIEIFRFGEFAGWAIEAADDKRGGV